MCKGMYNNIPGKKQKQEERIKKERCSSSSNISPV